MLIKFIVCLVAGIGAGLGTGFAGMSAAAVISPMLITFLDMDPSMACRYCFLQVMFWRVPLRLILMEKIKY